MMMMLGRTAVAFGNRSLSSFHSSLCLPLVVPCMLRLVASSPISLYLLPHSLPCTSPTCLPITPAHCRPPRIPLYGPNLLPPIPLQMTKILSSLLPSLARFPFYRYVEVASCPARERCRYSSFNLAMLSDFGVHTLSLARSHPLSVISLVMAFILTMIQSLPLPSSCP
eukprot:6202814-Pleurochrysis_carterae.AAC.4